MPASNSRSSDLSHLRAKGQVCIKFQTRECLFNISEWTRPPGSPSIPLFLLVKECDWHTPPSTLNSAVQGLGPPSCVPLTSWLLYLVLFSSFLSSSRHMFRDKTTLDSLRYVSIWLCLPYIYNKLSLPPYLGAIMSFPFLFMYFFT